MCPSPLGWILLWCPVLTAQMLSIVILTDAMAAIWKRQLSLSWG